MSGGFISSLFRKKTEEEEPSRFGLARVFKHEELKKATNSFTTELGVGGFGSVYLGKLRDGKTVAVKVLHDHNPKRLEQFVNEVIILSGLRHKNLVTLYGCTNPRGKELLLVYEYVPNCTVDDHLHGQRSNLALATRVRIAVETAEALVYLHALHPPLIHRDVKTSNIMLDQAFHVKLGDLGMSRLLPWDTTQVSTVPQGTMGYRDPEYDRTFILTDKSDVYSFGVLLVELVSRKKAVDVNRAPDNIYLADLALKEIINKKLDQFVDPKLGYKSNIDLKRVIDSVAELACKCLHSRGTERPTMRQVLTELKGLQNEMQHIQLDEFTSSAPLQELDDGSINNELGGIHNEMQQIQQLDEFISPPHLQGLGDGSLNNDSKLQSLSSSERAAERERMVLDIAVKLQGLWLRFLRLHAAEDLLSSFEYSTILALIESDAEGMAGNLFVECIREHIHSGWQCHLTNGQFIAVKELLKTIINRALSCNDMLTIRDALEVSAKVYKNDSNNVQDYVQCHLLSLSIPDELRSCLIHGDTSGDGPRTVGGDQPPTGGLSGDAQEAPSSEMD